MRKRWVELPGVARIVHMLQSVYSTWWEQTATSSSRSKMPFPCGRAAEAHSEGPRQCIKEWTGCAYIL